MSSVVLLSAGLDSSYNLFRAKREIGVALALTFDYGQKAASREIDRASTLCRKLQISHKVLVLNWFKDFTSAALVSDKPIPAGDEISIDDTAVSLKTKDRVWVPNRNGIMLNIGAAYAEGLGAEFVVPGFNAEEAATFPDNSQAYLEALNSALEFSTANHVKVKCYSTAMSKTEIVKDALRLELPLVDLWPCYHSGEKWCGRCESCQRFARALREAGTFDSVKGGFA